MTAAVLAGLGIAAGILLVLSGLFPAPVPIGRALAQIHSERATTVQAHEESRLDRLLGGSWERSNLGARIVAAYAADLRITGQTPTYHLAQRGAFLILALVWAPFVVVIAGLGGVRVGQALPLWVSLALAPVGVVYPGLALRSAATDRRRGFRHALGAFLDVVAVSLASGRGVDTALRDGASAGSGWPFEEIDAALIDARLRGESPWAGLVRLSQAIDVPELAELAASAELAGNEGARVRASLAAKAKAIRVRGLAEVEGAAQSATERMTLPIVLLMVGFIVFLGYPAVDRVLHGI